VSVTVDWTIDYTRSSY